MEKRCSRCTERKPLSEFYKNKRHKYGVSNQCILCGRLSNAEHKARKKSEAIPAEIESLPGEEWRWVEIDGERYKYKVSNLGRVASYVLNQPYIMSTCEDKKSRKGGRNGYIMCSLRTPDRKRYHNTRVHRLVALAFVPNTHNLPQINHKDGDKSNNVPDNLEWCECAYNIQHAFLMGAVPRHKGELNHAYDKGSKVIHEPTGKVYQSIAGAARDLGVPRTTLNAELRGYRENKHKVYYVTK